MSDRGDTERGEIVVTGLGVVSPLGIGPEPFWQSLMAGRSGVRRIRSFDASALPVDFGSEIDDFDPKVYVRPRKSLKVMSRDIQIGFAAADMAVEDAKLTGAGVDPERIGVVFGADMIYCELDELATAYRACLVDGRFDFSRWGTHAMGEMYPLWLLKYLPNMVASHVGIAHDARGPTNAITLGEVSAPVAIGEAVRVIQRGQADVMIAGGASSRNHPSIWIFRDDRLMSHRREEPERASRPFDAGRDGMVTGEGAAAFVLETRRNATARGATVLATIRGQSSTFQPLSTTAEATAVRRSIELALREAEISPVDVDHVNAGGLSTVWHDRVEAQAIRAVLGDVPVTAPTSYFGNLGAGAGAVELAVSVLALRHRTIPATLNYEVPDPECPVNVVHGKSMPATRGAAVSLNQSSRGQAAALVITAGT